MSKITKQDLEFTKYAFKNYIKKYLPVIPYKFNWNFVHIYNDVIYYLDKKEEIFVTFSKNKRGVIIFSYEDAEIYVTGIIE